MPGSGPGSSSMMSMSSSSQQQQQYMLAQGAHDSPDSSFLNSNHSSQGMSRSLSCNNTSAGNNNLSQSSQANDQNNNPNNNANNMVHEVVDSSGGGDGVSNSRRDFFEEIRNGGGHWSQLLRQVVLTSPQHLRNGGEEGSGNDTTNPEDEINNGNSSLPVIPLQILGGSENGHFAYVGLLNPDITSWIAIGYLQPGDVILDIQGQQVAGYTQADVLSFLHHCLQRNSATLTVAPRGSLGPELRSYLNTRFQKGSVDHALQGVVRDNLYLRTVPVTTRTPRPGEIPGVDYTFLSVEEFMELERNGSLLESGVYAGNHYGTPKPWASRLRSANSQLSTSDGGPLVGESNKSRMLPGIHPSSEGKRRRNRSNVEALGAGDDDPPSPNINNSSNLPSASYSTRVPPPDELGPLPANWEMSYTEKGEVYFIDHNTGTSHWLDPRLSRIQKLSLEDCADNELPFGWERIEDPHYGTYYIDHVNRRTQFENPVIQAKSKPSDSGGDSEEPPPIERLRPPSKGNPPVAPPKPSYAPSQRLSIPRGKTPVDFNADQDNSSSSLMNHSSGQSDNHRSSLSVKSGARERQRYFTRDPVQLVGERIHSSLFKSSRGLGFTIVGGDDDDGLDEFLQIKSVVTDGPAWREGKLRTGDVLVRVNGRCVLGYTHQEMVSIFQSIGPGEEVHLEVCRGYPLPFDPTDPNTEIVTTVAVAPSSNDSVDKRHMDWNGRAATPDSLAHSAHSLPELSTDRTVYGKSSTGRPASVDLLLDSPSVSRSDLKGFPKHSVFESGVFIHIGIVKGNGGFGFTIADSLSGQKVKKVLDSSHCGGLEEGDRLIAIDGIDLRGLSHTQVVQVLKDFPLGREATLTIQRITQQPSYSHKFNTGGSTHYSESSGSMSQKPGIVPRSKTPTADLGRTRPKVSHTLPERPKTPLLDSSGHLNGPHSLYNGEQPHPRMHSMQQQQSHSYLPERFSSSSLGMTSTSEPFVANDLNQLPIIRDWIELTIELQRRQEGFGFRIVGGTEEGSQVSVGHIVPNGAAALDGRLQTNDQLVAVEGVSVIGASHHSVVQLMARSAVAGKVRLSIRRPIYGSVVPPSESDMVASPNHSPSTSIPLHVTLRRQPTEGFGFVIISSASKAGATIGRIVEGSPADRCGQVHVGDRILGVNQIDISQLHHSQVVQLIKDSGLMLTLSVLPVEIETQNIQSPNTSQSIQHSPNQRPNMMVNDLENLTLKSNQGYDMGTAFISPESHPIQFNSNHHGTSYSENMDQLFAVQLNRGNRGFGFSIRGGKEFQNMPLFVLRLAEDGPAAQDGRMQVGDQILQINGISTQGMTHSQAIHIIKTGEASVHLLLRRGAVPFPFLTQMPNFSSGFGSVNGHDEVSLSSNNDPQQFISQSSLMYRDSGHGNYPS